jgi:hypothetical protein
MDMDLDLGFFYDHTASEMHLNYIKFENKYIKREVEVRKIKTKLVRITRSP